MDAPEFTTDEAALQEMGRRLARHRLNRDWTQALLAEEAGVSLPTVARLERGESASMVSFLRVLRALELMRDLARLVPDVPVSPVQQLRTRDRTKRRASRRRER